MVSAGQFAEPEFLKEPPNPGYPGVVPLAHSAPCTRGLARSGSVSRGYRNGLFSRSTRARSTQAVTAVPSNWARAWTRVKTWTGRRQVTLVLTVALVGGLPAPALFPPLAKAYHALRLALGGCRWFLDRAVGADTRRRGARLMSPSSTPNCMDMSSRA